MDGETFVLGTGLQAWDGKSEVPAGFGVMSVMLGRHLPGGGDTKYMWDSSSESDVAAARRHFNYMTREARPPYVAFNVDPARPNELGERMPEFNPLAQKVIFAPQLQGG